MDGSGSEVVPEQGVSERFVGKIAARLDQGLRRCPRCRRRVFAVIDQSAEARAVLELRDTTLVIFGTAAGRTAVALGDGAVLARALRLGVGEQCWPGWR